MEIERIIVLVMIILFFIFLFTILILGSIQQHNEMKKCADKINYPYDWSSVFIFMPFRNEYSNETTIICCYTSPVVKEDGSLGKKCYIVEK